MPPKQQPNEAPQQTPPPAPQVQTPPPAQQPQQGTMPAQQPGQPQMQPATPQGGNNGSIYSIFGIICAVISLLLLPIVFMPLGIVLGSIGMKKGDKTKGLVAIILSAVFGVMGMILGAVVATMLIN